MDLTNLISRQSEIIASPQGTMGNNGELIAKKSKDLMQILTSRNTPIYSLGSKKVLEHLCLRKILPSNIQDFYYYDGSLTTPPCNQAVKWILFKNPITISSEQVCL